MPPFTLLLASYSHWSPPLTLLLYLPFYQARYYLVPFSCYLYSSRYFYSALPLPRVTLPLFPLPSLLPSNWLPPPLLDNLSLFFGCRPYRPPFFSPLYS